ncbi:branched-chain amino acid transport system II carrier protein [Gillisia limnaea]|uniref:Branched-chain amino acid transport system II carrier protein n=1 Tax=Gillisia limnaea (strain DSM 15749 / LMG 21470 / R-8282) TaxID=865937 RepID=H2BSI1_GILLR|nr:branched-chain amino acid transport system II carrier protein [Gillisia limnaea]EHQ02528.1 branched-chain amino acid transport system II carrier protein [Gillisia limnaea DSM 15749]
MKFTKEAFLVGFALFALFFGAGNLILPPYLGFFAGSQWYLVALGFVISAVGLPLLGIFAHAQLQGSIFNFANKVSPVFSLIFSVLIYLISVVLPAPRTAAVTYEIAVQPFFDISALTTSIIYFLLVFLFVIKRTSIINNIGKFLTPAILVLLLAIIISGVFSDFKPMGDPITEMPVLFGFFEGYQTFDAIAALVVGGVIIISVKLKADLSPPEIRKIITSAAIIAALGLLFVYGGLIYNGAIVNSEFPSNITRTQLLSGISFLNLGAMAQVGLSLLVALACFTTAVGIITGTADFMKERINKPFVYPLTVSIACILGVVMGALSVNKIIEIALPVLMLIYPLTIVLILLNVLPENYRTSFIMRAVVAVIILFSLPDALQYVIATGLFLQIQELIPFALYGLGWVLPGLIAFVLAVLYENIIRQDPLDQKTST